MQIMNVVLMGFQGCLPNSRLVLNNFRKHQRQQPQSIRHCHRQVKKMLLKRSLGQNVSPYIACSIEIASVLNSSLYIRELRSCQVYLPATALLEGLFEK